MKYAFITLTGLALLWAACGGASKDPAQQLAQLREQKAAIEAQIAELEKQAGGNEPAEKRIRLIGVSEVQPGPFRHYIDIQGRVEAEDNVPVTAKMPGVLTKVLVKNGDAVRKGQLLAVLDDEVMQRGLAELELQLRTAEDLFNRQKSLWDQGIGSEIQLIQARTNKEAVEQRIATTKEQMAQSKIYAPIAGTVDMVILKQGQAISPGVPLCNIVNLGALKVHGEIPETYVSKVRQGAPVKVFFPDLKKEIDTRITYVSKTINPTGRTFAVECALPAGAEYRANMIAVLKIIDYENAKALTVPVNVIQTADDGDFILTLEKTGERQGVARKTTVKQGVNYNGQVEIVRGLDAGQLVITTGFQEVNNGETVAF
ncbi:MAG: efflux RND transporter periplasmic adaptor subunit [Saprospiraceae bacterium]